jgi:hypothetical protein
MGDVGASLPGPISPYRCSDLMGAIAGEPRRQGLRRRPECGRADDRPAGGVGSLLDGRPGLHGCCSSRVCLFLVISSVRCRATAFLMPWAGWTL